MESFKEKFLRMDRLHALAAVYDTFPQAAMPNDLSGKTVQQLYQDYIDLICAKGRYTMPDV